MVSLLLSREYLHNIGLVDSGVAEMESIIEDFFGYDGRTAYVFTSDHGMTNWGNTVFVFVSFILWGFFEFVDAHGVLGFCMCIQVPMVQAIPLRHSPL